MNLLKVLTRECADWVEVYINGNLVWNSDKDQFPREFLRDLIINYFETFTTVEWRSITHEYEQEGPSFEAPVFVITGENYFDVDWPDAEEVGF